MRDLPGLGRGHVLAELLFNMSQPTGFRELTLEDLDHVLGGNTDAPPFPMDDMETTSPDLGPFTEQEGNIG